jgi:hypothetical protein
MGQGRHIRFVEQSDALELVAEQQGDERGGTPGESKPVIRG